MSGIDQTFKDAETALKVARLVSSMSAEDWATAGSDAMNILRILAGAPYGATTAQITALNNRTDERYTQGIINLLIRGGMIESYAREGQTLYRLRG